MNEVNCVLIFFLFVIQSFHCLHKTTTKTQQTIDQLSNFVVNYDKIIENYNKNLTYEIDNNENIISIEKISPNSVYTVYNKEGLVDEKYDGNNILLKDEFWCSTGNHGIDEEVNLDITLDKERILNSLWIYWAFAPGEFRLRYSYDNKEYYDYSNTTKYIFALNRNALDLEDNESLTSTVALNAYLKNPLLIRKYHSFAAKYYLDQSPQRIKAKYLKISFRIPINKYYAIYDMKLFERSFTIGMIRTQQNKSNFCLSLPNHRYNSYSPLLVLNCENSIAKGDNRDLFIVRSNGYIVPYEQSSKCLMHQGGNNNNQIILEDCHKGEEYNDERNKIFDNIKKELQFFNAQCLSIMINDNTNKRDISHLNKELFTFIYASSTIKDTNHFVTNIVDYDSSSTFWISDLSSRDIMQFKMKKNEPVEITMILNQEYPIYSIEIKWKYPAKIYNIYTLVNGNIWKKISHENTENSDVASIIYLFEMDILGIKIELIDSSTKISGENVFGISKIFFNIRGFFVVKSNCEQSNIQWDILTIDKQVDPVNDTQTWREYLKTEALVNKHVSFLKKEIEYSFNIEMRKIIDKLITQKSFVSKRIDADLEKKMGNIKNRLFNYITLNTAFLDNNHNDSPEEDEGNSEDTPAADCSMIKSKYPTHQSGYYYIQSPCMKKPLKVYCDFEESYNYHFLRIDELSKGNTEDLEITINEKCTEIGLEPFSLPKNITKFDTLDKITNDLIINHQIPIRERDKIKYIIPIALLSSNNISYRFFGNNETLINNQSLFQAFIPSPNSSLLQQLDQLFSVNTFNLNNNILSYFYDFKLEKFTHTSTSINEKNNKILGFFCSTNNNEKYNYLHYPLLTCFSNLESIPSMQSTFRCPRNCLSKYNSTHPYEVIGSNSEYYEKSMICPSAIHSGLIDKREGGLINIKVVMKAKEQYESKEANEIISNEFSNTNDTGRGYIIEKFNVRCPVDDIKSKIDDVINQPDSNMTIPSSFIEISDEHYLLNSPMIKSTSKYSLELLNEYISESSKLKKEIAQLTQEYKNIYYLLEKNNKEIETLNILMDKAQNIQKNKNEIQAKELNQLKDQYKSLSPP